MDYLKKLSSQNSDLLSETLEITNSLPAGDSSEEALQHLISALNIEIETRKMAENALEAACDRFQALFDTAGSAIVVIDHQYIIHQWNNSAENLFGYSCDDAMGQNYLDHYVPPAWRDETAWKIRKVFESEYIKETLESECPRFDGSTASMLWNLTRLNSGNDGNPQVILVGQDISEIRQTQNQLHHLAHYDSLTGAANRRLFEDRCTQAIKHALRNRQEMAVLSLDIDFFKRINDTLGHDAGDALLIQITRRLQSCVRGEDTIARLGGDEFAVLLLNVSGRLGAEKVARNILKAITEPLTVPGGELIITTSIGITLAPSEGKNYQELMKNADMAMYRAKKTGRNGIQFYSEDMNSEMQQQMRIEHALRTALKEDQLKLFYQPIFDLESGKPVVLEALLRWEHPEQGLLLPDTFIYIAEQTGQLQAIGEWVIRKACLECQRIQSISGHSIPVSVNLSPRQFIYPQLTEQVQLTLEETLIDPGLLIIEIGEKSLIEHIELAPSVISGLKALGVKLCIDHFGSDISSLSQLCKLPIDFIKIDRTFIQGVPVDHDDMTVTETLLGVARQIDIKTFVAGVESRDQEAFLKINGCQFAQGFLYSKALSGEELEQFFLMQPIAPSS